MASTNDECNSSEKKDGKRGATRLPKTLKDKSNGIRKEVQWSALGQPIGPNSVRFASFLGLTVRRLVPITIRNWRSKKDPTLAAYKDNVWDEIQQAYVVGDEHKQFVMGAAGWLHRAWRTNTRNFFLTDENGNINEDPPSDYPEIKQEHWDRFVATAQSDAFQKLSKGNRERALNPQYPYKKSRKGYARLQDDMLSMCTTVLKYNDNIIDSGPLLTTLIKAQEATDEEVPLYDVWLNARLNKKGVIDNDEVQKVADKCKKLAQTLPEEIENRGRKDILFQCLSDLPEYPGRVRGLGSGVCAKVAFSHQVPPSQQSVDTVMSMYRVVCERLEILEREKQDKQQADEIIGTQKTVEPVGNQEAKEALEKQNPSINDSFNTIDFDTIPKGTSSIRIYVASPARILVADGKLLNTEGDTVHGMKLPPGYVKVAIEVAVVVDAPLLIPIEDGEVSMIGQAVGTIVPWSFNLIEFAGECKKIGDKNKDKKIQESAKSVAPPIKRQKTSIVQPNKNQNPSINDSFNIIDFDTIPKGTSSIRIYVASPTRILVARGKLLNTEGDTVHGMKLPPGYVKVAIEVAVVVDALLLIPIEDGEVSMIGQAVGTIVPWSFNLIEFAGECKKIGDKNKDKKIQESAKSVAPPIKRQKTSIVQPNKNRNNIKNQEPSPGVNGSEITKLQILQVYMTSMWPAENVMEVSMGEKIFGVEYPENMHAEHMLEVANHEWLSASVIAVYARYLYDEFISPGGLIHKISFLSPHVSTADLHGTDIAKILLKQRREIKDKLILAPYNFDNVHWVLLVIDLDAGDLYYLDSLGDEPSKYENFQTKFNKALQVYHTLSQIKASKSKLKVTWKTIKCPRQTNGIDCGYFVMRFMKEIVMQYPNKIPENYFVDHKCRTYSKDKLHEVKEEWEDYMVTNILPEAKFLSDFLKT